MQHLFRRSQQKHTQLQTFVTIYLIASVVLSMIAAPVAALAASPQASMSPQSNVDNSTLESVPSSALAAPLAQSTSCLAIDEWTDAQLIGNTGGITSSVVSGAGILGGERDMFYTDLTPPNANGIYANVDPAYFLGYPILEIANASGRYSKLTIVWDGADGDATTLAPGGLGGIDLLAGGATAFTATISTDGMPPATPNFPVTLTVYDTSGGVSQLIVSVPPLNSAYAPFSAPFASFTAIAGGGADFAQVGAISMVIDMTATYLNNWDVVLTRFGRDCQAPTTGTITVIKNTVGGEGTFDFSSPDSDLAAVSLTTVGGTASSSVITKSAGTYTLTEDALAGWQLTNISFSGDTIANSTRDNGSGQAIIRLDAGENITVTYTNAKIDLPTPVTGVLTVTKTIVGNGTGPFNLTINGPSGYVTTTTIDGGQTKVITGLVSGLYTVTETSPGAGWTTVYTATTGYSTGSSAVVTLTNSNPVAPFASTQITGTVFSDYNSDGRIAANGLITDTGVQSVTVTIYDSLGNSVSTGTDASGLYTVTPSFAGPYRVEFTNLPSDYEPSRVYTGTQNGTTVQFINSAAAASGVNLVCLFHVTIVRITRVLPCRSINQEIQVQVLSISSPMKQFARAMVLAFHRCLAQQPVWRTLYHWQHQPKLEQPGETLTKVTKNACL